MRIVPEMAPAVGGECVIARRGEDLGFAGRLVALTDSYAVMLRAGDARRIVLFAPRSLTFFSFRACSPGEANMIGAWQRQGYPGVCVLNGGRTRIGEPVDDGLSPQRRRRGPT